ncbi:Hypothetical_protein [Hexamita inflata]|uniref:Hypothetical_protein n=1 Tax=Hexamita inflata TaxID=28002 RepID=A0AA86Q000_9EUKA|nr:Hypothetical protein HINF_LOCUS37220 [Hexamita inflata]
MCIKPFIYNGRECECSYGYLIDGNVCVDVIHQLKALNQNDIYLENQLMNNISEIKQILIVKQQETENNLKHNTSNLENMITQSNSLLLQELDIVKNSVVLLDSNTTLRFSSLQDDLLKLNNQFNKQVLQTKEQLFQTIISLNTSQQVQFDTQKQQINTINQNISDITSIINQHFIAISQVNNKLQTQIDGTKSDVRNVQNSIIGINGLINNINNVNQIQNNEIQALKSQSVQNMNGVFWCKIAKLNGIIPQQMVGYCSNLNLCCQPGGYRSDYQCAQGMYTYASRITTDQCGTYYTF